MASGKFLPKHSECAGLKCTISHKGQSTNNRSLKCTNCWADDHASNANTKPAAKYAKKPTQKTRPYPRRSKCANYDSAKKNIIAFSGKDDIQSNFYP